MRIKINVLSEKDACVFINTIIDSFILDLQFLPTLKDKIKVKGIFYRPTSRIFHANGEIEINVFED